MAYKVVVDAYRGGNEIGTSSNGIIEKDYNLLISKYINERLNELGLESILTRDNDINLTDDQRIDIIKNNYGNGNNIIVLSNRLNSGSGSGAEVMYALRNNSRLASLISDNLDSEGVNVNKFYQLRNSNDTSIDDDYLIRNTKNNQTLVIYYGYPESSDDVSILKDYEKIAEAVVKAIATYANVSYIPKNIGNYYVVQKGDSLWSIAVKYNTTVDIIKDLNNLKTNNLSIGQILRLPSDDTDNNNNNNVSVKNTYTVEKGDSLYKIANKFNTTVDNIKKLNNLSSNLLSIGQILIISENTPSSNEIIYTVQKGDSLYAIAVKYDTTVDIIKNTNNLSSNLLSIGQKLIIPSTSNYITYTVEKGDSLYKIANKYNTTVDNIKKLNNLSSNLLSIDQKLIIPA